MRLDQRIERLETKCEEIRRRNRQMTDIGELSDEELDEMIEKLKRGEPVPEIRFPATFSGDDLEHMSDEELDREIERLG